MMNEGNETQTDTYASKAFAGVVNLVEKHWVSGDKRGKETQPGETMLNKFLLAHDTPENAEALTEIRKKLLELETVRGRSARQFRSIERMKNSGR